MSWNVFAKQPGTVALDVSTACHDCVSSVNSVNFICCGIVVDKSTTFYNNIVVNTTSVATGDASDQCAVTLVVLIGLSPKNDICQDVADLLYNIYTPALEKSSLKK